MRFRAVLELHGKTATGVEVPAEVVDALGSNRRPAVIVCAGDELDVDLELDAAPREVEVPADLAVALKVIPGLRQAFDALAFTHRKEHVRAIEDAKTAETRARRITKAVDKLSAGLS